MLFYDIFTTDEASFFDHSSFQVLSRVIQPSTISTYKTISRKERLIIWLKFWFTDVSEGIFLILDIPIH